MHLIQILLPIYDNRGRAFPGKYYQDVYQELTDQFSGITAYNRSPAEGSWRHGKSTSHDHIVIYEVMVEKLNKVWWHRYRLQLQKKFRQRSLVIRRQTISLL
jgi:hypothetical protein